MKGIVLQCAIDLVRSLHGEEILKKALSNTGIPENSEIIIFEDYPDELALKFIQSIADITQTPPKEIWVAFGNYWILKFAKKKFRIVYGKYSNAREFIKGLDETHRWATQSIEGATPPRFIFEEPDDKTLIIHYFSKRKLDALMLGQIQGVLRHFNEDGIIEKIESDQKSAHCAFRITFQ